VGRALRSKKLSPKFLGPYQITRRIGPVAYEIALPPAVGESSPGVPRLTAEEVCV